MNWVLLFGLIALGGLITMVSYAVWLWHKASDLFSELEMLAKRAEEFAALLNHIQPMGGSGFEELASARQRRRR